MAGGDDRRRCQGLRGQLGRRGGRGARRNHGLLVNHYYLYQHLAQKDANVPLANYYFPGGAGALVNVAGAGIVDTSRNKAAAERFIAFLLSQQAQQYFASQTDEYPLAGQNIQLPPACGP